MCLSSVGSLILYTWESYGLFAVYVFNLDLRYFNVNKVFQPAQLNHDKGCGIVWKISLVTGLSFNLRIHVFMILSRMEVVITYRAFGTELCWYTREGVSQSQDGGIPGLVGNHTSCHVQNTEFFSRNVGFFLKIKKISPKFRFFQKICIFSENHKLLLSLKIITFSKTFWLFLKIHTSCHVHSYSWDTFVIMYTLILEEYIQYFPNIISFLFTFKAFIVF